MTLFRALLGDTFDRLPPAVRAVHGGTGPLVMIGTADVVQHPSLLARLICAAMRLPAPGRDVPVTLVFVRGDLEDRWSRNFAGRRYASRLFAGERRGQRLLIERMGPITSLFRLIACHDALRLQLVGSRILGVPLPRWIAPRCHAEERDEDGCFTFDIPIDLPWLGRLIRYRGRLTPQPNEKQLQEPKPELANGAPSRHGLHP
jgi:hypothetical protein